MRIRHAAPLVALAILLMAVPATAAEKTVNIEDSTFVAANVTIAQGDEVTWRNQDGFTHTSTRTTFPTWSHELTPEDGDSQTLAAAGTYAYHCAIHSFMQGSVKVRAKVSPTSGTKTTTFAITVATGVAPAGSTYVIQRKAPGGSFNAWKTTTAASVTFKSATKGTWQFRSKIMKLSNSKGSGYSPAVSLTIG